MKFRKGTRNQPKVTQKPIGSTSGIAGAGDQDRMNSCYLKAVADMEDTQIGKVQPNRSKPVKIPTDLANSIRSIDPVVFNEMEVKRRFINLERHLVN